MVHAAGRGRLSGYYRVAGGSHVDGLFDMFPDRLRPLTPCHRGAFRVLESWLDGGRRPPAGHTVPLPRHADPERLVTDCSLTNG